MPCVEKEAAELLQIATLCNGFDRYTFYFIFLSEIKSHIDRFVYNIGLYLKF